jgi:hypothetical protein
MRFVLTCCLAFSMSGCLMNNAYQIRSKGPLAPGQSIVVFGAQLNAEWGHPEFGIILDEYSLAKHGITGNCFRYTRLESGMPSHPSGMHYFAFQVPAGAYIYSIRNAVRAGNAFDGKMPTVFVAPAGATVYFGDFVYDGSEMKLQGDLASARAAVKPLLAGRQSLTQAETTKDEIKTRAFLCTP